MRTTKKNPKKQKTKILAVGDIHGDLDFVKKISKQAEKEKVDVIIVTGDITFAETNLKNIIGPLSGKKRKVLFVPGNHETLATANFLAELYHPHAVNLHGYSMKFGDFGVFGCGLANVGINQLDEKEIYNILKRGWDNIRNLDRKIMVTHIHPSGSIMEKMTDFFPGSTGVEKAIHRFKPDILLCSHVHEAAGLEEKMGKTKIVNVSKKVKIFEI